jgi:hypothetical protein
LDMIVDTLENIEILYLLSLILLFLLTLKAFWFADTFIIDVHPGSIIFVFFDLLFHLKFL